jgi:hypothetical protein
MKKIVLSSFMFVLLLSTSSQLMAQRKNALKVNLFSPVVRTGSFFYERVVSEHSSLQLGFFYTGFKVTDTRFSGFGITPEFRYYLSASEAPEGFYVGPFVRYQNFKLTNEGSTDKATLSTMGGGVVVGKQWLFKDRITLDTFIGPSFNSGSVKVDGGDSSEDDYSTGAFDGFGLRLGLTLGVAF